MSDYRHATDRIETTVVAGCPNGCQVWDLDASGDVEWMDELVDKLTEQFDECPDCGEPIRAIRRDEPKETLD